MWLWTLIRLQTTMQPLHKVLGTERGLCNPLDDSGCTPSAAVFTTCLSHDLASLAHCGISWSASVYLYQQLFGTSRFFSFFVLSVHPLRVHLSVYVLVHVGT